MAPRITAARCQNLRVDDEAEWLASLRPSQIRKVQAGATSWAEVVLIDIESGYGSVLRSALETFGLRISRVPVGQARHLVQALSEHAGQQFIILACHGDERSLVLPELAPELERHQPFHRRLSPDNLRSFARFNGAAVIATGCDNGHPALALAVLDCGASSYVAPDGAPFGYASFFAPLDLFYELTEQRSLAEAVSRLRRHDNELGMWQFYA